MTLDAAYAALRAAGAHALRELSRSPRTCCLAACGRTSPPSTRSRGSPTTSPMKATRRSTCATRGSTSGWLAWMPRSHGGGRRATVLESDDGGHAAAVFTALGATRCATARCRRRCSRTSSARFARTHGRRATPRGPTCSTTAGARPTRSAASCCASAGWRERALDEASDAVCTALQLTNFWQDLAVDWTRGRLYVPAAGVPARRRGDRPDLDRARITPRVARRVVGLRRPHARPVRRGRAVCDGVSGRLRWELRADLARRHAHPRSARSERLRRLRARVRRWAPSTCRRCCGGARWSGAA